MVARQIRQLMSRHAATRAPFSNALHAFCRRYVMAWSNAETDIDINGERWLAGAVAMRAPAKDSVFVTVGVNVGDWGRMVHDYAPGARLVAFEPAQSAGDNACAELGITHIHLLKIDAQGQDLKVIEGFRSLIDTGAVDVIQFRYNYMSIVSRTFLRDFFAALTPQMRIARLLRDRIEYFEYAPALENFIQANFIAVRADLAEGRFASLARR